MLQQLFNTLSLISIVVIAALGLAIIFGLMNVINMAHGEMLLIGAVTAYQFQSSGISVWWALVVGPIMAGAFGLVIEVLVIRRLYWRVLDTLLATWALGLAIREGYREVFGPSPKSVSAPLDGGFHAGDVVMPYWRLFIIGAAFAAAVAVVFFFYRTWIGLELRAAIANPELAATSGIPVQRVYTISFVAGSALAGFAGVLLSPIATIFSNLGFTYLVDSFFSVVLGGIGSIVGTVVGGSGIGLGRGLLPYWLSPFTANLLLYVLAVIAIRLRPAGLLARTQGSGIRGWRGLSSMKRLRKEE